jgi:hypothetical protein
VVIGSATRRSSRGTLPFMLDVLVLLAMAAAVGLAVSWIVHWGPVKRWRRRLRTRRHLRRWARVATPVERPCSSRVVVSLTVAPSRLIPLQRTVATLLNQSCVPDEIHINVPWTFRRTGEDYVLPTWMLSPDARVMIHRVEDDGPATKTVATVERIDASSDTLLIIADDDTLYPQRAIEVLLQAHVSDPAAVHGCSGYGLGPSWESVLAKGEMDVEVIEGWAGFVAHRRHFAEGFPEHVRAANECRSCLLHDDIVVSNWFALQGVRRRQIHDPSFNRRLMRELGAQQDYGYLPDALHQGSAPADRARLAAVFLSRLGLWRLVSPSPQPAAQ